MYFNFMVVVTIYSDFGAPPSKKSIYGIINISDVGGAFYDGKN